VAAANFTQAPRGRASDSPVPLRNAPIRAFIALVNYGLSFVLSGSLISRIGMSCGACPRLLRRSGEHTVQLRNTGFEKLLEVLSFLC